MSMTPGDLQANIGVTQPDQTNLPPGTNEPDLSSYLSGSPGADPPGHFPQFTLDEIPSLVCVTDPADHFSYRNPSWLAFSAAGPGRMDWEAGIHPQDLAAVRQARRQAAALHRAYHAEYRCQRRDGALCWLAEDSQPLLGADGGWLGYLTTCALLPPARPAVAPAEHPQPLLPTRSPEEPVERFRSILEDSLDGIYRRNLQTRRFEYLSPAIQRMLGYPADEFLGISNDDLLELVHPEDRSALLDSLADGLHRGKSRSAYRFRSAAGGYRWLSDHFTLRLDGAGAPLYRDGFLSDLSPVKEFELSLGSSEYLHRVLFEESPVPLLEIDITAVKDWLQHLTASGTGDLKAEFERHPDLLARCNRLIKIVRVNKAALQLYRAADQESLIARLNAGPDTNVRLVDLDLILAGHAGGTNLKGEWLNHRLDGSSFYSLSYWVVLPSQGDAGSHVLVCTIDISEQKRSEEQTRKSAAKAEALARVAGQINCNLDLKAVLNTVCQEIARALALPAASLFLYNPDQGLLHAEAAYGLPQSFLALHREFPLNYFTELIHQYGSPFFVPDIQAVPGMPNLPLYMNYHFRTIAGASLYNDGQLIGVLFVNTFSQTRTIGEDEKEILQAFADQVAVAIQNARMFAELDKRTHELESLVNVSAALRQSDSLPEMVRVLVQKTRELFAADNSTVVFQKDLRLEIMAALGKEEQRVGEQYPKIGLWDFLLNEGPHFFPDTSVLADILPGSAQRTSRQRITEEASCAVIPLVTNQTPFGLLHLGYQAPHAFTEDEKHVLSALADVVSNALQRAGVMDTLERRVSDRTRELETLYLLASLAGSPLDLPQILEKSLRVTLDFIGMSGGCIHLIGAEEDFHESSEESPHKARNSEIRLAAHYGVPQDLASAMTCNPLGSSLAEKVAAQNEPLILTDITGDDLPADVQRINADPMFYIGLPIQRQGRVIGVMSIFGGQRKQINAEDIALLTTISDQMGVVIENARLRRQAEMGAVIAERQRLARELHDSITQILYSLNLYAGAGINLAQNGDREIIRSHFQKIESSTQRALKEMRLMIYELRPSVLEEEGLVMALRRRLEAVEGRVGIGHTLITDGDFEIPSRIEAELYRIAQEALNNALKHARATAVVVHLVSKAETLTLQISDDGTGFDLNQVKDRGGYGLSSMQERAQKIGGRLTISSSSTGTQVNIEVKR